METIKVWPTKKTAVGLKHPHGPELAATGALWPNDSFTMRRLVDGSATKESEKAFKEPAPEPAALAPETVAAAPVHAAPSEAAHEGAPAESKPAEEQPPVPDETKA